MTSARYIFCSGLSVLYKLIEKILANDFRISVPFGLESTTHWRISITEGQACGGGFDTSYIANLNNMLNK